MTYLCNGPAQFADEMVKGFAAANDRFVRRVRGGVVRRSRPEPGKVALVVGGGSGHYPAFAGLVGPGLAHGAAMGNLFAAPSDEQVYQVAKAAESGAGVLLSYGNYAGDVLNFDLARERLGAEGIECRSVVVTDDLASAPPAESEQRRGIAGDLFVFKVAGAVAEGGADLERVARVATKANAATRSFGVAFSGCTLPGADTPLFTVPEGRMAVGMGIHGEPGIGEREMPTADELAMLLVDSVFAERPGCAATSGERVAVILNGLGAVKYEELFVLYGRIAELLADRGVVAVDPEVGELVTSLGMAGVSLTVCWLDEELESLWRAPASTPAYRKEGIRLSDREPASGTETSGEVEVPKASPSSQAATPVVLKALQAVCAALDEEAGELGRLDAVAGDGDHGIGMCRGAAAAVASARALSSVEAGAGTMLDRAGAAWADRGGGTSGALWGLMLRALGSAIGDDDPPRRSSVVAGVHEAKRRVMAQGRAQPGDKSLVDPLTAFTDILQISVHDGEGLATSWAKASAVADRAAAETAALVPRIGRARTHPDASVGTPDPGAMSMALVIRAVAEVLRSTELDHA